MHKIPFGLKKTASMVVLRNEQQFLLLKRAKEPNKNTYVPVGGKLDPFEDPITAAIRETKEETGILIQDPKYGGYLIESSPTAYNWQCHIYMADIDYQDPPYCDEGILEWIHFDQLKDIPSPPTDWQIYQYLVQGKPFAFNAIYNEQLQLLSMKEEIEGIMVIGND